MASHQEVVLTGWQIEGAGGSPAAICVAAVVKTLGLLRNGIWFVQAEGKRFCHLQMFQP